MIYRSESIGPFRWVEALGVSLAVHAGVVFLVAAWLQNPGARLPERPAMEVTVGLTVETEPVPDQGDPTLTEPVPDTALDPGGSDGAGDSDGSAEPDPQPTPPEEPAVLQPVTPQVESLSPVLPEAGTALAVVPEVIAPAEPEAPGDGLSGDGDEGQGGAGPVEIDPTLAALIERIRARLDDPCFVALPRISGGGDLELLLIADDNADMAAAGDALLADLTLQTSRRDVLVDARQCPALAFVRSRGAYPAMRLSVTAPPQPVASGASLQGFIQGGGGRALTLLMVDDNGVVQDLTRFLSFAGPNARFDVPVERTGASRETGLILIALATPARPGAVEDLAGLLAEEVFPALEAEIGQGGLLGLAVVQVD